ncbi:SWIM zinc finger family protein [Candidatus Methanocrinis natronophilus]|uniref:SWIM zinc finger family protein n=1 Tax=Candidatus Methanocrinis natronophilus TaxID=3033396 RepID=A0ABT5XAT9_9EURY|nr:SWIM zinc finger family protein [Candidatus Methanocrinis natronophilus]MDF0591834.1 SWIM zinc finger family protein [Candidatus Methanocrinis natronophilus]
MMPGYWGYYETRKPIEVEDGIKAKSRRGAIGEKWWSKRWVALLESFKMGARLGRGRSYARKGQVVSIDVQKGLVRSQVQGVMSQPYDIEIRLASISDDHWEKAVDAMASKAIFAAKLLSGEMPKDIEEAFVDAGCSLFPKKKDIKTDCSCPDWADPCKHIAAVYYILAEKFDEDPFLIFKLRGRTKEEIVEALRERRASTIPEDEVEAPEDESPPLDERPLEERIDRFWELGDELDLVAPRPRPPEVPGAVLKRLGDAPVSIDGANLASCLPRAYEVAGRAARDMAAKNRNLDLI